MHLPQGATITRVVVVGTDNTGGVSSSFGFDLFRTEITPTSSGNPTPVSQVLAAANSLDSDLDAVREIADTTFCSACVNAALVDNTQYQYGLQVFMRDLGPGIVEVYAAYVEYTLP